MLSLTNSPHSNLASSCLHYDLCYHRRWALRRFKYPPGFFCLLLGCSVFLFVSRIALDFMDFAAIHI